MVGKIQTKSERSRMQENQVEPERAYLVGVSLKGSRPLLSMEDSLEELMLLANTAGMEIGGTTTHNVAHIAPATFIGGGQGEEGTRGLKAPGGQSSTVRR